jgi:hypothetical protein
MYTYTTSLAYFPERLENESVRTTCNTTAFCSVKERTYNTFGTSIFGIGPENVKNCQYKQGMRIWTGFSRSSTWLLLTHNEHTYKTAILLTL